MLEGLIFGVIQGITEWLPVSSEGVLTLVGMKFFDKDLAGSVSSAVFLHLGTFLAALVYFRKDVFGLFKKENKKIAVFLVISTLATGVIALPLLYFVLSYFNSFSQNAVIFLVGFLLIITGLIQFKKPENYFRNSVDLKKTDGVLAGIGQGLAVLPGLSRSGLTVAILLFRKFRDTEALKLSFLMSLPAVLAGNIFLNLTGLGVEFNVSLIISLIVSFVVGYLVIGGLLKISRKINFAWFAILFGVITLASLLFISNFN